MARFIFTFFFLSFSGWVLETVSESIVREKPVNKGFFRGPWVPVQGLGGIVVYLLMYPLRAYPALIFFAGAALCTALEYLTALFLEHCFRVRSWDYTTYPYTRWCHFRGRICLTISLFFGIVSLVVVYFYWSLAAGLAAALGTWLLPLDGVLLVLFTADVCHSCVKIRRLNREGVKLNGWNVFSVS
ncbi:MAG: putative ABC transporter permease [Treponema sp.]|nr:putative ABC transporter permease [Treponema sp.]